MGERLLFILLGIRARQKERKEDKFKIERKRKKVRVSQVESWSKDKCSHALKHIHTHTHKYLTCAFLCVQPGAHDVLDMGPEKGNVINSRVNLVSDIIFLILLLILFLL